MMSNPDLKNLNHSGIGLTDRTVLHSLVKHIFTKAC